MDLKTLKKTRGSQKSKLTIFKQHLDTALKSEKLNRVQLREISNRLDKIRDMYNDFDSTQTDIESITEISEDEVREREGFEAEYFKAIAVAEELLSKDEDVSASNENGKGTRRNSKNTYSDEIQKSRIH